MDRYSEITNKNQREIVLLKAFPCVWGKCSFCDYILDNSNFEDEINKINFEVLENITGKYKVLEVINSGSCFELPKATLAKIKEIIKEKKIEKLFLESHWAYKNRIQEMRDYFESRFEGKNMLVTVEELKEYFDSPCIMVGIKGQTREMIDRDMDIVLNNFDHATINVFVNNTSSVKRDEELVNWFSNKYKHLVDNPKIEVLFNNTDFGVGD